MPRLSANVVKLFASALVILSPIYYLLKVSNYQYYILVNISVASFMVIYLITQQQNPAPLVTNIQNTNGQTFDEAVKENLTEGIKTGRMKVSLDQPLKMKVGDMDVDVVVTESKEEQKEFLPVNAG